MSGENEKAILRLVDRASGADDFARAILDTANDDAPKKDDLTKLSARLAAALPPGALGAGAAATAGTKAAAAGAAGASASAAKAGFSLGVKGIIAVAVLSAGAGAIVSRVSTPERVVEVPQVPQIPPNPSIVPAMSAPAIVPTNLGSPLPSASDDVPAPSASSNPIHTVPSAIAEPEATILSRAHEALVSGDAQTALDLTTQHQRAYPHGALSEERERIAIEALVRLGKRDQARARGAAFMKTYPQSTYRARIESILGDAP